MPRVAKAVVSLGIDTYAVCVGRSWSPQTEYGDPAIVRYGDKRYLALIHETSDGRRMSLIPGGLVHELRTTTARATQYDERKGEEPTKKTEAEKQELARRLAERKRKRVEARKGKGSTEGSEVEVVGRGTTMPKPKPELEESKQAAKPIVNTDEGDEAEDEEIETGDPIGEDGDDAEDDDEEGEEGDEDDDLYDDLYDEYEDEEDDEDWEDDDLDDDTDVEED